MRSGRAAAGLLALALSTRPASADDPPRPPLLTGRQVAALCRTPCASSRPAVARFCQMATGAGGASAWAQTPVPPRAELEAECRAEEVTEAPAAALPAGSFTRGAGAFGVNQSAVIWGATDFLLSRAELELRQWAIDRFLASVCGDGRNARIGSDPIFPSSCRVLQGAHLAGFLAGMATYQAAVRRDLAHLPVIAARNLALGERSPQRRDALLVATGVAHALEELVRGTAPLASLQSISTAMAQPPLDCGTTPVAAGLLQGSAVLAAMTAGGGRDLDVPDNPAGWAYTFMAVALNASGPLPAYAQWPAGCGPRGAVAGAAPFEAGTLLAGTAVITETIRTLHAQADQLRNLPAGADPRARAAAYAQVAASLVSSASGLLALFPGTADARASMGALLEQLDRISRALASASYAELALELGALGGAALATGRVLPPEFLRMVSFAVDIAQAPTADAAAGAIERFAAPAGGYVRKRRGDRPYARLNAYVGLHAGVEWARQATGGWDDARPAFTPGFWVPVGLELGTPIGKGWSLGVLAQAVDLGVLASWRVRGGGDDVANRPVVGFDQVLAPGGALVLGFPDAPLSLALGAEVAPKLREVDGEDHPSRNAVRVGLSLAVDIPVFP